MKTPYRSEPHRIIPPQFFVNFPENIDPLQYEIIGYLQGERINTKAPMNINLFDSISFLSISYNHTDTKMEKPVIHAVGYRRKEESLTIIVMR